MQDMEQIKEVFAIVDCPEGRLTHFYYEGDEEAFNVYFPNVYIRKLIARVEKLERALTQIEQDYDTRRLSRASNWARSALREE